MNLCEKSSHGDTFMCQSWYDYIKGQKYVARTRSKVKHDLPMSKQIEVKDRTRICTDRETDRQTDGVIPLHHLTLFAVGIIKINISRKRLHYNAINPLCIDTCQQNYA